MQWTAGVATAILLLAQVAAGETIQGSVDVDTLPGGVTFYQTGASAGDAGGATFHFTGFDPSAFGELYWGVASDVGGKIPLGGVGPRADLGVKSTKAAMAFASISGAIATWSGTASWVNPETSEQFDSVPTMFTITISDPGSNPWVLASSLGLSPSLGALVDNSSGLDFSATLEFFADIPTDSLGFIPINEVPQSADGLTRTSFNGGFYYTHAAPAPTAGAGLIGMALTVAALALRRRCRVRDA